MNAERLLTHFGRVADAPDAIPRLRRFILDLAVRGKLVPQDSADEPASELLKRIAVERSRLVKVGEIKRQDISELVEHGEQPFELPEGWHPTRLATVSVCLDYMRRPINSSERELRIANKAEKSLFPYYGATQQQGWIDDYIFDDELVLLGEDGVPFFEEFREKAYLIRGKTWVNNHAHVFRVIIGSSRYLVHWLNVFDYSGRVAGATRSKLNQARAVDIPIPLPPLAEQHRIVAKVDELMALCDNLETARAERETMRDRFAAAALARLGGPDPETFQDDAGFAMEAISVLTARADQIAQIRQTILDLAVRGLLVHQDSKEEAASAFLRSLGVGRKSASRQIVRAVDVDPDPFHVPSGWVWTKVHRLLDPQRDISYGVIKLGPEPKQGGVPTLRCSDVKPGHIQLSSVRRVAPQIEAEFTRTRLLGGEVIINIRGTLGGVATVPAALKGFNVAREVAVIPIDSRISGEYIVYMIMSKYFWDSIQANVRGIAYKGLNLGTLREFAVPLPPLAEQRRIVAKVDELMSVCDQLEASLNATVATRRRLLATLLAEALAPVEARAREMA